VKFRIKADERKTSAKMSECVCGATYWNLNLKVIREKAGE
jgi:hypothetical protein